MLAQLGRESSAGLPTGPHQHLLPKPPPALCPLTLLAAFGTHTIPVYVGSLSCFGHPCFWSPALVSDALLYLPPTYKAASPLSLLKTTVACRCSRAPGPLPRWYFKGCSQLLWSEKGQFSYSETICTHPSGCPLGTLSLSLPRSFLRSAFLSLPH